MRCTRTKAGTAALVALCCVMALVGVVRAESLGNIGPVYPIQEEDLIDHFKRRMQEAIDSGEMERRRQEKIAAVRKKLEDPEPVQGITEARESRTYYHDPGIVTEEPILDDKGKVIVPVGTYANALESMKLSKGFLFFDATSRAQREQAQALLRHYQGRLLLILVGGSPTKLRKEWQMRVYYDQGAHLTKKLGITEVPALVTQEGKMLRIDVLKVSG